MKKMLLCGVTAVALMAAGTAYAAHAGLSLTGETGVARTPLAIALAPMTLGVAVDYVFSEETFVPVRAEFGVIEGLEIGGNYWYTDLDSDLSIWGLNAKYVLPFKLVDNLSTAIGINYQSLSADGGFDASLTNGSAVITYVLDAGVPVIPSVGLQYESQGGDLDESGVRFFGSLIVMVRPNLAIGGEYMSTNDDLDGEDADANYWVGARFMPMEGLTVQAGYINNANINNGDKDASDGKFHLGAQYAFGFGK